MNPALLDRLETLRRRLADLDGPLPALAGPGAAPGAPSPGLVQPPTSLGPLDLLVTHCEVSERHGTGVLLRRLFLGGAPVATVRSVDLYGGEQDLGVVQVRLEHDRAPWAEVIAGVLRTLGHLEVRRILCVPYFPADVLTALASREIFGAPMCTWVMDDQNIEARALPDDLLRRLFARSRLVLAISPELQRAYRGKFGRPVGLAPPAVSARYVRREPGSPDAERLARRHGLIFGNIWGDRWLEGLLRTLDGAGVSLDWHSGGGTPWRSNDAQRLRRVGVVPRPRLEEPELVAALRASPFVVVPSGSLEGGDSHGFLARLSLPSRLPYVAATAGTPVVVLGHPETAAARFVLRYGLGTVAPYERSAFRAAVEALCADEAQAQCRAAAAKLAPLLSDDGLVDWIWRSLELGRPVDQRFQPLEHDV